MDACGTYIHQRSVDVVAAFSVYGDEEGEASVGRKAVHEAILILVSRQQSDAAVLRLRLGSHRVQRLHDDEDIRRKCMGLNYTLVLALALYFFIHLI